MQLYGHARMNGNRPLITRHPTKYLFIADELAKESQVHANVGAGKLEDVLDRLEFVPRGLGHRGAFRGVRTSNRAGA